MTFLLGDKLGIFVSSTIKECAEERAAAKETILSLNLRPILFEDAGARPHPPRVVYLKGLAEAHLFVGIYRESYGWVADDMTLSGVEDEYRQACELGLPRLIYVFKECNRDPRLQTLILEIEKSGLTVGRYSTVSELEDFIRENITATISERFVAQEVTTLANPDSVSYLDPKTAPPSFLTTSTRLDSLSEERILEALSLKSIALLRWPQNLKTGEWIDRPELHQLTTIISERDDSVTALLGSPGTGKSALLARLGTELKQEGVVLLALKADLIPRETQTMQSLQSWLALPASLQICLKHVAAGSKVVILVDQLDALCDLIDLHTERLAVLTEALGLLQGIKNVHVVLSCREFEFRHDVRFSAIDAEEIQLSKPTWDQVSRVLDQHGLDLNGWPEGSREILRIPQQLNVFLALSAESTARTFDNYQAMLEELWQRRVLQEPGSPRRVILLDAVAREMSDREELWLPVSKFDDLHYELQELEAAEILRRHEDGRSLTFAHQTLFDFARARAFCKEQNRLSDYVMERQNALFVRPILWSTLVYLRGADSSIYRREFARLWNAQGLRKHVRLLMIEFLGQLPDPNDDEASWLLPEIEKTAVRRRALIAMQGSPGWFHRLEAGYFSVLMSESEDSAWEVLPVLTKAVPFARDRILELVEQHWLPKADRAAHVFRFLMEMVDWDSRTGSMAEVLVKRTEISAMNVCMLASQISASAPSLAPNIIRLKFDADLAKAREESARTSSSANEDDPLTSAWSRSRPCRRLLEDSEGWHELEDIAKASAVEFAESIYPWYVAVIQELSYEQHPFINQYKQAHCADLIDQDGDQTSQYPVLSAIAASILGFSQSDPTRYLDFLTTWDASNLEPVHTMLARGLTRLVQTHPQNVLNYLMSDPRRLVLGDHGDQHRISRQLIAALVPHLGNEDAGRLEGHIIGWNYYSGFKKDDDPRLRFDRLKWNREHRLRLLRAFPKDCLTLEGRQLLDLEERALPDCREWDSKITGGFIGSPMSLDNMQHAKDEDILNLFHELPDSTGTDHPLRSLVGGSIQASQVFAEFAKQDPDKARRIIEQLNPGENDRPAGHAIRAMAEGDKVSGEILVALITDLNEKGFSSDEFRSDAAHGLGKISSKLHGLPDSVCHMLRSWLQEVDSPTSETHSGKDDDRNASLLWNPSGIRILPHGNYPILEAITFGYLLRQPPAHEAWLSLLEIHLATKEDPAVWDALAINLQWLNGASHERAEKFLCRLFEGYPTVLHSKEGVFLIAHIHHYMSQESLQRWLRSLKSSAWVKGPQAFAELVVLRHALYPDDVWCRSQVEEMLDPESTGTGGLFEMQLGASYAAANLWAVPKCRVTMAPLLARLVAEANEEAVLKAILDAFRIAKPLPVDSESRLLLDSIIANPKVLGASEHSFLVDCLCGIVHSEPERVSAICILLVEQFGQEMGDMRTSWPHLASQLTDIALTLQRISSHRDKGLDLFERLLDLNVYGVKDTLLELDRRPSDARSQPRRRRKRAQ